MVAATHLQDQATASTGAARNILEVENLSIQYGDNTALDGVNLTVHEHEIFGIIGPAGSGKTSFLKAINRMDLFTTGMAVKGGLRFLGRDVKAWRNVYALRNRVGVVFPLPVGLPLSVYDNVALAPRLVGVKKKAELDIIVERCLTRAALWDEVKDRLNENGLSLSGGQQQRLCIARAIASDPEVLLLDEPCSALDPLATGKIEDLIHDLRGDYSILIVTHNMQQASRVSDYTAFMYLGHLIEYGPTASMFANPRLSETEDYVTGRFG